LLAFNCNVGLVDGLLIIIGVINHLVVVASLSWVIHILYTEWSLICVCEVSWLMKPFVYYIAIAIAILTSIIAMWHFSNKNIVMVQFNNINH